MVLGLMARHAMLRARCSGALVVVSLQPIELVLKHESIPSLTHS